MRSSVLDGSRNTSSALDEQQIERHVQDVAQSAHFLRAETLRKLLLYLWEHRHEDLSEYAVALEALGRRSDFDPKTDASVRVQISRLRRKLKDFYEAEGVGETYQLQIPMGTHMITALETATFPALPPPGPFPEFEEVPGTAQFPDVRSLALAVFASLTILLAILCAVLLREHFTRPRAAAIEQPVSFWTAFLQGGTPVKIILPTPVFFTIPTRDTLHVRDTSVNRYDSWQQSPLVRSLVPAGGSPTLDHSYTVTTDTLAAVSLARYLDRVGLGGDVSFEVTGQAGSMDLLEHASVVAFGAHSTLQPFRDYLATMNFSLATHEAWVDNAHPLPGEQARYLRHDEAPGVAVEPAIVALLPGRGANVKLLIMQSKHTSALVDLLTSRVGNGLVQKMYTEAGSPPYFEMVVDSEVSGDQIVRCWPVALHPYTLPAPSGVDVTR